jgi:chemotaxis protein CheC
MPILTEHQTDTITELINIAFSRTAAALSELTGARVLLDKPQVELHTIDQLTHTLHDYVKGEVATVHQIFSGPVAGDALLLLNYEGAVTLANLLTDAPLATPQLDSSAREVLIEVGNILLNACLGTFGNLLRVHISFSVPRLHLEELNDMLHTLTIGSDELRYALVVYTNFRLRDSTVGGYLALVLGVASLERLLQAVEEWEKSQVSKATKP